MIRKLLLSDPEYPELLKNMSNAPRELHVVGDVGLFYEKNITILCSRYASPYGIEVLRCYVGDLVKAGFVIVSGFDLMGKKTHESVVKSGGKGIAVSGFGLSYLKKEKMQVELATKIVESGGLIVSPFKFGQKPTEKLEVESLKIAVGLAHSVLVVEALRKDTVLSAVDIALELGREVYATPGSVFSYGSSGTHMLIKLGAQLVDCVEDIVGFTA